MEERSTIAIVARVTAVTALTVLGCLGILRDVGPAPTAAQPRARVRVEPSTWNQHVGRREREVAAGLRREPKSPELHLRMARCLYLGVAADALASYQTAFPYAFVDGSPCEAEYDAWRRGWFARDRGGKLRRAMAHGRRAALPGAPRNVRVAALQLIATILRECGRESAAVQPLLLARRIAPYDDPTRVMLQELRRRIQKRDAADASPLFRRPAAGFLSGSPKARSADQSI